MIIPDDTELIAADLDAEGIPPNESLWIRFDTYARASRAMMVGYGNAVLKIEKLEKRIAELERQHGDICCGRLVCEDNEHDLRIYRCLRCGQTQTSYGHVSTCGRRI